MLTLKQIAKVGRLMDQCPKPKAALPPKPECSECSGTGEVLDPFDDLEMYQVPCPKCSKKKPAPTADQIVAAFVQDRAGQYVESSGIKAALCELAERLAAGEHRKAYRHGELDDLLESFVA